MWITLSVVDIKGSLYYNIINKSPYKQVQLSDAYLDHPKYLPINASSLFLQTASFHSSWGETERNERITKKRTFSPPLFDYMKKTRWFETQNFNFFYFPFIICNVFLFSSNFHQSRHSYRTNFTNSTKHYLDSFYKPSKTENHLNQFISRKASESKQITPQSCKQ